MSSDDHQYKRDESNHSSSTSSSLSSNTIFNNHPLPEPALSQQQPPPANHYHLSSHGYPPASIGYPPQMMYPNAPYPNYPPPPPPPPPPHGYYNQYPSSYPSPTPSYYGQGYASVPQYNSRCAGVGRIIVGAIVFSTVISCLASLVAWIILHPQYPVFRVDKMSVSNFSTSSNRFKARWDTILTTENPNGKLKVYFDRILGTMFYDEDEALGSSWLKPVYMDFMTQTKLHVVIYTNRSAENAVPIYIIQAMSKDRAKGSVKFALRFQVWATLRSRSWWRRTLFIKVFCEDLKVNFVGSSTHGTLAPEKREDCKVYA